MAPGYGMTLAAGTKLDGKYEVVRLLGEGGAGQVYLGTHLWTKREVAIKVLPPSESTSEEVAVRFLREARATAKLRHPNVVDILDMGRDPTHGVYLVMECLQGETLEARLEKAGRLSLRETLELLIPVLDALATAHRHGIVHRDLKPANLFIAATSKGTALPKVLDFGIAKVLADAKMTSIKTATGTIMGTPYYMSPEQIDARADAIDHRTDIWSMCVVLYECITGERPFDSTHLTGLLSAIASVDYKKLAERPEGHRDPEVAAVIDQCLQFDPADRVQTMEEVIRRLRSSETGQHATISSVAPGATRVSAVSLAPSMRGVRLPTSSPMKRAKWLAAAAMGLLIVIAAGAWTMMGQGAEAPKIQPESAAGAVHTDAPPKAPAAPPPSEPAAIQPSTTADAGRPDAATVTAKEDTTKPTKKRIARRRKQDSVLDIY